MFDTFSMETSSKSGRTRGRRKSKAKENLTYEKNLRFHWLIHFRSIASPTIEFLSSCCTASRPLYLRPITDTWPISLQHAPHFLFHHQCRVSSPHKKKIERNENFVHTHLRQVCRLFELRLYYCWAPNVCSVFVLYTKISSSVHIWGDGKKSAET